MNIIDKLVEIDKLYYTISDIEKILQCDNFARKGKYDRNSIYVILNRLVKKGRLIRLTTGIYILPDKYGEIERIANLLYFPSYLSFESALSKYGIISLIPYTINFATTRKTKDIKIENYNIKYRQLKSSLFFGYKKLDNGLFIASPEKSLLDTLYISSFGKIYFSTDSIDIKKVNLQKLKKDSLKYPKKVQLVIDKFLT